MELNSEHIKRALEWLDSLVGNSNDSDIAMFTYQLLGILYDTCEELAEDLHATRTELTRVQEENERLRADNIYGLSAGKLAKKVERLSVENERLKKRCAVKIVIDGEELEKIKKECLERVELDIKAIQADTVRKMQERIKAELIKTYGALPHTNYFFNVVDRIAKEMLEGKNAQD